MKFIYIHITRRMLLFDVKHIGTLTYVNILFEYSNIISYLNIEITPEQTELTRNIQLF